LSSNRQGSFFSGYVVAESEASFFPNQVPHIRGHQILGHAAAFFNKSQARPDQAWLHRVLADAYRFKGMDKESVQETERVLAIYGDQAAAENRAPRLCQGGLKRVLEWRLSEIRKESNNHYVSPYGLALRRVPGTEGRHTLRCLGEAYQQRPSWVVFLKDESDFGSSALRPELSRRS
jgi:hypothetical protein